MDDDVVVCVEREVHDRGSAPRRRPRWRAAGTTVVLATVGRRVAEVGTEKAMVPYKVEEGSGGAAVVRLPAVTRLKPN